MTNETKTLRIIIVSFVFISVIGAYYIGYMSARLGLSAPFISGNGAQVAGGNPQEEAPKLVEEAAPIKLRGDEIFEGKADAKMVLVTFTDFQCPFCARFHPGLKALFTKNENTKLVIKHFPLNFHPFAKGFATEFECIAKNLGNDKAMDYSDDLFALSFSKGGDVTDKDGLEVFKKSGLSEQQLNTCKSDAAIKTKIDADYNEGVGLGINGTPALYIINSQSNKAVRINGALDESSLQAEFDKIK